MLVGATAAYWLNPRVPVEVIDAKANPTADGKHAGPLLQGLDYTQVKDGKREWTLYAKTARMSEKARAVVLDQVMMSFYAEDGGKVTLQGKTGTYSEKKKVVSIKGRVRARSHDGIELRTQQLRYRESDQVLSTKSRVIITGPQFTIKSKGMVLEVDKKRVTFLERVETTFTPSGNGPPAGATVDDS